MGRRLVVTVVLDEGLSGDIFDQLGDIVCRARGVVGFRIERFTADGEEQDSFGPAPRQDTAEVLAELEAVGA
jgi:hypothetical protein